MCGMDVEPDNSLIDSRAGENLGSDTPTIEKFTSINAPPPKKMAAATMGDKETTTPATPKKKIGAAEGKKAASAGKKNGSAGKKRASTGEADKSTPTKKRRSPSKPKEEGSDSDAGPANESKSKFPKTPKTFEEAGDADRFLMQMKEAGKPMKEINAMWEKQTGVKPGNSSLFGRYVRLKANFARLKEGDDIKLVDAVRKWQDEHDKQIKALENGKFQKIASLMEADNCDKYSPDLLKRQLKIINAKHAKDTVNHEKETGTEANGNEHSDNEEGNEEEEAGDGNDGESDDAQE